MDKQKPNNWRIIVLATIAVLTLPLMAVLVFLIFEDFDMSKPSTWLFVTAFVVLMLWDQIAQKTYKPMLNRFLSRKSMIVRFFGEEIERTGILWLFPIAVLLTQREEDFFMLENPFLQAVSILGLLIVFCAFWVLGRVWLASRRDARRNLRRHSTKNRLHVWWGATFSLARRRSELARADCSASHKG